MTYLTDLATACRASGLRVIEVSGWRTRGHGGMAGRPRGVVCHWTATPDTTRPSEPYPSMAIVRDGRTGLPGPLANLGLGRDGTVYVIAAGLAYHAGTGYWPGVGSNGNGWLLGIEAEEGGDGDWTPAMLAAYPRLCAALRARYGFPVGNVIGHHEWAPSRKQDIKSWPGGMAAFRRVTTTPPEEFLMSLSANEQEDLYARIKRIETALNNVEAFVEPEDDWRTRAQWLAKTMSALRGTDLPGLVRKVDELTAKLEAFASQLGMAPLAPKPSLVARLFRR